MADADFEQRLRKTHRNDPCPCGSGKKYKKCHLLEDEAAQHKALKEAEEEAQKAAAEQGEEDSQSSEQTFKPKQRGTKSQFIGKQSNKSGRTVTLPRKSGKS